MARKPNTPAPASAAPSLPEAPIALAKLTSLITRYKQLIEKRRQYDVTKNDLELGNALRLADSALQALHVLTVDDVNVPVLEWHRMYASVCQCLGMIQGIMLCRNFYAFEQFITDHTRE